MRVFIWWLHVSLDGHDQGEHEDVVEVPPVLEIGGPYGFGHRAHHPDPQAHYAFGSEEEHRLPVDAESVSRRIDGE